jgi:hypothetical protein
MVVVASRVGADAAQLCLGEVPALGAEPNALLHVLDRARKRQRSSFGRERRKGESLRRPLPDSGELRELRHEVVDGR